MIRSRSAVASDDARRDRSRHWLGRVEDHGLDLTHPFAPAQLHRRVCELGVEILLRSRPPSHVRARTIGKSAGRSTEVQDRMRTALTGAIDTFFSTRKIAGADRVTLKTRSSSIPVWPSLRFVRRWEDRREIWLDIEAILVCEGRDVRSERRPQLT